MERANLWIAIVSDVGTMLLVTIHSTFLLRWNFKNSPEGLKTNVHRDRALSKSRGQLASVRSGTSYGSFGETSTHAKGYGCISLVSAKAENLASFVEDIELGDSGSKSDAVPHQARKE